MRTEDDNPRHLDCPGCPECTLPCGTTVNAPAGLLRCAACGHTWTPGPNDLAQAKAADAAWEATGDDTDEEGERQRKVDAIAAEHARRQLPLFDVDLELERELGGDWLAATSDRERHD